MKLNNWISCSSASHVALGDVRLLPYDEFSADLRLLLSRADCSGLACGLSDHSAPSVQGGRWMAAYFAVPYDGGLKFYAVVADDDVHDLKVAGWVFAPDISSSEIGGDNNVETLGGVRDIVWPASLTPDLPELSNFEREIAELYGVHFMGHPWLKPLRFVNNSAVDGYKYSIDNYPFFDIDNRELHHVHVGPVHAGVIEPGAFRFICRGEQVLHLEIALGYQHRGVEPLIVKCQHNLRRVTLAESIAGDSVVAHSVAMCHLLEGGAMVGSRLDSERFVALEMERIAMHLSGVGALCMDLAYQLGQVTCEALRTMVINAQQRWSGSRFAKGLIRPFGSNFPLNGDKCDMLTEILTQVHDRFSVVASQIITTPTVLSRLEEVCAVTTQQALRVGVLGMAARSIGVGRDARRSHPFIKLEGFEPIVHTQGDLLCRLKLRIDEIHQSYDLIMRELSDFKLSFPPQSSPAPQYSQPLAAEALHISVVEGWRGAVVHCAVTSHAGHITDYKVYDPSFHNWAMLALSVRGAEISDFPISNKSYDLSYCGHDL